MYHERVTDLLVGCVHVSEFSEHHHYQCCHAVNSVV